MDSTLLGIGLHVASSTVLFFGLVSALIWLARFAKKETVVKVTVWALGLGILGSLVSIPWAMRGAGHMMRWTENESRWDFDKDGENSMQEMMDEVWDKDTIKEEPAAQ